MVDSIFWEMLWMYLLSCQDLDEKTDSSLMQCILNSKLQHSLLSTLTGNMGRQLAWLRPTVTKCAYQHF